MYYRSYLIRPLAKLVGLSFLYISAVGPTIYISTSALIAPFFYLLQYTSLLPYAPTVDQSESKAIIGHVFKGKTRLSTRGQ